MSGVEDAHREKPQGRQDERISFFLSTQKNERHKEHRERFNSLHSRV